jgi:N6-adenosine-specific RNA methylase IME4
MAKPSTRSPHETLTGAMRPIDLAYDHGTYTLTSTACLITGRPTFDEHAAAGNFIKRAHRCSGFWLADWLRYGDERHDWNDRIAQIVDATGLSEKTVKNVRAVGAIEQSRRRDGVEFSLHEVVAALEPNEQTAWLEAAEREGWNRQELRMNIRAARRRRVVEGQATLEGMYRVFYVDCPWLYNDSAPPPIEGSLGKAERHYPGMTVDELCALPVEAHALPDAVMFFWVTAPMLYYATDPDRGPDPYRVIRAWGFTPKTGAVWDKVLGNFGHYFHVQHEHLIVATRGSCLPDHPTPQPKSVITERRSNVHSEKPPSVRHTIEALYSRGPFLELFGRDRVLGWDVFGNDARLWAQEASAR